MMQAAVSDQESIKAPRQVAVRIHTPAAPEHAGHSQGIVTTHNKTVYISGQLGIEQESRTAIADVSEATRRIMVYLQAILQRTEMNFDNVTFVRMYLTDIKDLDRVDEIYGSYFKKDSFPARDILAVAALPYNARVQISMIATKSW